jgi:diguanylate cyclase (GGDEF)-like protein
MASDYPALMDRTTIMGTEFEASLDGALRFGSDSRRVGVFRVLSTRTAEGCEFIITNAEEEEELSRRSERAEWTAETLTRLGRALSLHHEVAPLTQAAMNTLRDCIGLAGGALWVESRDGRELDLSASFGFQEGFGALLKSLRSERAASSTAALAASRRQPLFLTNVNDTHLTSEIEGRFAMDRPGGVFVAPLLMGTRLLGVLELVSKAVDARFLQSRSLLTTVADHLALALNGALLFETAERMAAVDPLTAIANHRTLLGFLNKRVSDCQRGGGELGVIMLDVDHFRRYNEEEGHDAGDVVLRKVAEVLEDLTRGSDLAARYGGEEFTIVMPGSGMEATRRAAERVREAIRRLSIPSAHGGRRPITASLGCSVWSEGVDAATLLKMADTALYRAKRGGRDRVRIFRGEVTSLHSAHADVHGLLAEALQRLPETEQREALGILRSSQAHISTFERELNLSRKQVDDLEAAIILAPAWLSRWGDHDRQDLREAVESGPLTPVLSVLQSLFERHDGEGLHRVPGARIPTLGKILNVLIAMHLERGSALTDDPGRFDPKIAQMALAVPRAA